MNDLEYEQKFLVNLLRSPDSIQVCLDRNIVDSYFKYPETRWIFKISMWHHQQYRQLLQSDSLLSILQQSKTISESLQKQILVNLVQNKYDL